MLTKTKLNTIEVSASRVLIDWYINHDEFVSVNKLSREYDDMTEIVKNLKPRELIKYVSLFIK